MDLSVSDEGQDLLEVWRKPEQELPDPVGQERNKGKGATEPPPFIVNKHETAQQRDLKEQSVELIRI